MARKVSDYADQDQSRRLWLRRLGHFYHENLEKYLTLHSIKVSKCLKIARFQNSKG